MIDTAGMTMGLFAGLALFLLGMNHLSDGLKNAAGDQMRLVLEKFTKNRFIAALTGAGVTAVVQSSSVTTVLVVGFVSAHVMTLSQSVGVIMGAKVGSTITAQIVAFSVEKYAPLLIAAGFFTNAMSNKDKTKHVGSILLGLGLVFFGMGMMSGAMAPLRTYQPFIDLMQAMAEYPLLGILLAAIFTALVQSSSATTGIVVVMASEGLVSLEAGIAMALGANIGTCVTALLAAIGKRVEAQRAAVVHIILSIAGVLLWFPFISVLAQWTVALSPSHPELEGIVKLAAETPRQIANANTLFNAVNVGIFIIFTGQIAKLATWLIPEKEMMAKATIEPKFLNETVLGTPAIALHAARLETARLGEFAVAILDDIDNFYQGHGASTLDDVRLKAALADQLYPQVIQFLSRLGASDMREIDRVEAQSLAIAASEFNLLCDLMSERLVALLEAPAPEEVNPRLRDLYLIMRDAVVNVTAAVREQSQDLAREIVDAKADAERLLEPPQVPEKSRDINPEIARRELDAAQVLRMLLVITRRVARTVLSGERRIRR